jgi:hypothetical protein
MYQHRIRNCNATRQLMAIIRSLAIYFQNGRRQVPFTGPKAARSSGSKLINGPGGMGLTCIPGCSAYPLIGLILGALYEPDWEGIVLDLSGRWA